MKQLWQTSYIMRRGLLGPIISGVLGAEFASGNGLLFFIQGSVGYHLAQVCMGVSSLLPTHTHIYPCQGPTMGLYPYGLSNLTSQNSSSKYHRQVVSTL